MKKYFFLAMFYWCISFLSVFGLTCLITIYVKPELFYLDMMTSFLPVVFWGTAAVPFMVLIQNTKMSKHANNIVVAEISAFNSPPGSEVTIKTTEKCSDSAPDATEQVR